MRGYNAYSTSQTVVKQLKFEPELLYRLVGTDIKLIRHQTA